MKLLVDARVFVGAGVARYLQALSSRWLANPRLEELRFLGDPAKLGPWLQDVDPRRISRIVPWTDPPFSARAQLRWWLWLHRQARDADVTFFPYHDVPLLRHPRPSVVAVHDLTPLLLPQAFAAWKRLPGRILVDGALRKADRVVTVSENSRTDILARAPELASRLVVIPNGVDPLFRPLDAGERTVAERRWARFRPYLLVVGSARPHKNLELAVEVLARLRGIRPDLILLVAGPQDRRVSAVVRRAEALGVDDAVEVLGVLEDEELRMAYAMAELFLFPSLYEGFGLPPLEAMACGTPVLSSDRGPLPEVLGDAAVLLDPLDPQAWASAATRLLEEPGERELRVESGLQAARRYSWDRAASQTLEVLMTVSGDRCAGLEA